MEKALEILKQLNGVGAWERWCLSLPSNTKINEAISELEEAMKPKTCDGCVYFRDDRQCWIENINNYLTCKRHTFELPMVDRYEPKDNK